MLWLLTALLAIQSPNAYTSSSITPAEALGWIPTDNFCEGYYEEPKIVSQFPNVKPPKEEQTYITSDHTVLLAAHGRSTLLGHIILSQKGRQVTADKADVYRDNNGKLIQINLFGNVHFYQASKTLVAEKVYIDMKTNTWTFYNVIYRLHQHNKFGDLEAWGTADEMLHPTDKIFNIANGTYSTCAPTQRTWSIKAKTLHINKKTNRGTIKNGFLRIHHVPVFYLPYWNFPISRKRKTGFLFPTFSYSNRSGFEVTSPFYWNMAPNYDETLYPKLITRRGGYLGSLFRFLTPTTNGNMHYDIMVNDKLFSQFKSDAVTDNSGYQNHALNTLQDANDDRMYLAWQSKSQYDPHWSSQVNINYLTDDYFFQDFGNSPQNIIQTQLPNNGEIDYGGEHWNFGVNVLGYQTLHPLNQGVIEDQYWRLPDLTANGNYPDEKLGLTYAFDSEFVHFEHAADFASGAPFTTGNRYNIQPDMSLPFTRAAGYLIPDMQFALTAYDLRNPATNKPSEISRTIPLYHIDSGLFFERGFNIFGHHYQQTLQPRLFYLYVPYHNQSDIPDFDTTLPTFNYDQLFSTNRFIGYDRIGDANQLAYGLTSNLLDSYTGNQKLSLGVGQLYYFQQNRVCLPSTQGGCNADPSLRYHYSPVVGEGNYNFNSRWSGDGTLAWDPNRKLFDNGGVGLHYQNDPTHMASVNYQYVHEGDIDETDYSRLALSSAWGLTQHWLVLGSWDYNLSQQSPQTYLYGVEYNSCCWAIRLIENKTLLAIDSDNNPVYERKWYVQLQLKGLGNFGNSNPTDMLAGSITGYHDKTWR